MASDDAVAVVAAFNLAREVTLRTATGWLHTNDAAADTALPASAPTAADVDGHLLASPLSLLTGAAEDAARLMAEGDDDLTEIVEIVAADIGRRPTGAANAANAALAAGTVDIWEVPFAGQVRAEVGMFGDGTELGLQVADASGGTVCLPRISTGAISCAFTPDDNSFYTVTVTNRGGATARYMLLTN